MRFSVRTRPGYQRVALPSDTMADPGPTRSGAGTRRHLDDLRGADFVLVIRAAERLGPGELAYVDPDAELIFVRPGLPWAVEQEVLKQANAGMLGRWDLAPDTACPSRSRAYRPFLRVVHDEVDTDEVG